MVSSEPFPKGLVKNIPKEVQPVVIQGLRKSLESNVLAWACVSILHSYELFLREP